MANWIYFVLIAELIWSFTSVIDKIVISKGHIKNPLVYIVLNGFMNVLLIFFLPFFGFEPLKLTDMLILFLFSGALFTASVALYYKAVQYDEISKIVILYQLAPIFILALSFFFLNEVLTKNHLIGFFLLLGAGVIVSYKKSQGTFKLSNAFYLMLIAAFFGAIAAVSTKYIYSITGFWSAFIWLRLSCFTALGVLLLPSIRQQSKHTFTKMSLKIKALLSFKMIIDFSAFIFAGLAVLNGPISLVSALSNALLPLFVFIITFIASIYVPRVLKENIDKSAIITKLLAITLIIAGILVINL